MRSSSAASSAYEDRSGFVTDLAQEFLARALEAAGGVVEDAPGGLDALLPADVARRLDLAEEVRIHFSSAPPSHAAVDGRIGSTLLERVVTERLDRPALAA